MTALNATFLALEMLARSGTQNITIATIVEMKRKFMSTMEKNCVWIAY